MKIKKPYQVLYKDKKELNEDKEAVLGVILKYYVYFFIIKKN